MAARADRCIDTTHRGGQLLRGKEHVADIAGHRCQVHLKSGQVRRVAEYPPHRVRTRLGPGYFQRRRSRVHSDDLKTAIGEHAGETARPAADIEHTASTELSRDRQVMAEIVAVPLQHVIDLNKARLREESIRHTCQDTDGTRDLRSLRLCEAHHPAHMVVAGRGWRQDTGHDTEADIDRGSVQRWRSPWRIGARTRGVALRGFA
jgi:hypothetical protein